MVTFVLMGVGGLLLASFCVWQRRGRSAAARRWIDSPFGKDYDLQVLLIRPLIAAVLLIGSLGPVAIRFHGEVLLGLMILGLLLPIMVFLVLPLHAPRVSYPTWAREARFGDRPRKAQR